MDKFFVSMMRFSTAMTLFGIEQMQNAVTSMGSGDDLTASMEKMREAMDAFSDAVLGQVHESKRETADTVTRVSEDTVKSAWSDVSSSFVDPREMMRATTDMMKKTSDSVVHWMEGSGGDSAEEPRAASKAMGGSSAGKAKAS